MARAVRQHRILGITLIAAGLLRAAEIVLGLSVFTILWPIALFIAAAQLIIYREPEGAYEVESGHRHHG